MRTGARRIVYQGYELVKGPHIYLHALLWRLRRVIQPGLVSVLYWSSRTANQGLWRWADERTFERLETGGRKYFRF